MDSTKLNLYNMLPRVLKIVDINDYVVTCLFHDGQTHSIDFISWFNVFFRNDDIVTKLLDKDIFNTIACNGMTLYWPNLCTVTQLDGSVEPCEFDLDPIMLYEFAIQNEILNKRSKRIA